MNGRRVSFAAVFASVCAVLSALAVAFGAHCASRAGAARASLAAFAAEDATLLAPALRREEDWQAAVASLPPRSAPLPAAFGPGACERRGSDSRQVPGIGATLREESFSMRRIDPQDLARALDEAKGAGFRPVRLSVDAAPGGAFRSEITLISLEPGIH